MMQINRYVLITFIALFSLSCTTDMHARKRRRTRRARQKESEQALQSQYKTQVSHPLFTNMDVPTQQEITVQSEKPIELVEEETIEKTSMPKQQLQPDPQLEILKKAFADQTVSMVSEEETVKPPVKLKPEPELIEFYFENADLEQLIKQVEDLFDITFIRDDAVEPLAQGSKSIKGNKISFKTQKTLTKKMAWDLFLTFLDLAGFAVTPYPDKKIYRITTKEKANRDPLTTFIGVEYTKLPDNDERIRYVYFLENSTSSTIKKVLDPLRSSTSQLIILESLNGFILVEKSYNVRSLMQIVKELDKVSSPQAMSVLKLQRADAKQVAELYQTLNPTQQNQRGAVARLMPRKPSQASYFPEGTKIIPEVRTNSLILLGRANAIKKIEDFIVNYVDIDLKQTHSPLYVYQLKYADATTIAKIMTETTQFGKGTPAGESGGVRGGDKYLRPMSFTPEPSTNRIIIKGDYEDYLKSRDIIRKLDEAQPQVAFEVLLLSVTLKDTKEMGVQLRQKESDSITGLVGNNIKFQTSGLRAGGTPAPIQTDPNGSGVQRLLGDLINVVSGGTAGNTIVTLGQDMFGVWGVFQVLETISNAQVLGNPFLVATNKTEATVSLGEIRRVQTGTVISGTTETPTLGDSPAKLTVKVTPQINSDGMILLNLDIDLEAFIGVADPQNVAKTQRKITTQTTVADREVLALGGLIQNRTEGDLSKTPVLGDIPILGWIWKNKRKAQTKDNLLVLISSRIINPGDDIQVEDYTRERIDKYYGTINAMKDVSQKRDPIYRTFFADRENTSDTAIDDLIFKRKSQVKRKSRKERREARLALKRQRKQQELLAQQQTTPNSQSISGTPADKPVKEMVTTKPRPMPTFVAQRKRPKRSLADFVSSDEGDVV